MTMLGLRPSLPDMATWERAGSCDQCASGPIRGECCTHVALPISNTAATNPDVVKFFALHGIDVKWWGALPLAVAPLRCSALKENGDCALYGQPERPQICSSGPLNPWAAQLNRHCSYVFSE